MSKFVALLPPMAAGMGPVAVELIGPVNGLFPGQITGSHLSAFNPV
jgi:hypothetical protein